MSHVSEIETWLSENSGALGLELEGSNTPHGGALNFQKTERGVKIGESSGSAFEITRFIGVAYCEGLTASPGFTEFEKREVGDGVFVFKGAVYGSADLDKDKIEMTNPKGIGFKWWERSEGARHRHAGESASYHTKSFRYKKHEQSDDSGSDPVEDQPPQDTGISGSTLRAGGLILLLYGWLRWQQ
jgi:hypothetical protein